jgi:hypothetical protein
VVDVAAERSFDQALDELTARSHGALLTTVDDLDGYGPEHVWDLVLGRHYAGATVVGKAAEFVHLERLGVTIRRLGLTSESYATSVATGTVLVSRGDLASAGGWRPLAGTAEPGLLERISRDGGLTYRTHPLGYIRRRGGNGHADETDPESARPQNAPQWTDRPPYAEFGTA